MYRLPVKTTALLNQGGFPFDSGIYSLEEGISGCDLVFSMGNLTTPANEKEQKNGRHIVQERTMVRLENPSIMPGEVENSLSVKAGILVHRILEQLRPGISWQKLLDQERNSGISESGLIDKAESDLRTLFEIPEMQDWFSEAWKEIGRAHV